VLAQAIAQQARQLGIVFYYQHPHKMRIVGP
jgi:hypothetical protein